MQGIVNGVGQRRDKVWFRNQRRTLLDQKLSLERTKFEHSYYFNTEQDNKAAVFH